MVKRRNSINDQWSARRREMLESPAYRVLSQSAHRAISRIELELCFHGGNDNGQLPVTFDDFVEYGIDRASVAPALCRLPLCSIELSRAWRYGELGSFAPENAVAEP